MCRIADVSLQTFTSITTEGRQLRNSFFDDENCYQYLEVVQKLYYEIIHIGS